MNDDDDDGDVGDGRICVLMTANGENYGRWSAGRMLCELPCKFQVLRKKTKKKFD